MKKLLLVLFVSLAIQVQSQNYCDSVEILIINQSLTSVTCSSNTNGLNTFWTSQDWSLTDKYGSVIGTFSGSTATFSMPNPINSDTNYICLTSILSQPVTTIACNTCNTIVWNGANWVLLSMMMPPACNLTGGSVYLDYSSNPSMMNATVNGISQYSYVWNNGMNGVNQTQIYPGWCVTITDLATGCDTIICENCISIPCTSPCPMIYLPVCGCDGVQYANDCLAICAGVGWTPAISNGMPGGFLPCTTPSWDCFNGTCIDPGTGNGQYQTFAACLADSCNVMTNFACMEGINPGVTTCVGPGNYALGQTYVMAVYSTMAACIADSCNVVPPPPPPCGVEIAGDSIICSWGSPHILTASPNSSTVLPVTYSWSNGQSNSHILTITTPGTYCVTLTDAYGCVATECIIVSVQDIPIYSLPSPPICLGDSIVLEIDTIGLSNIIWVPDTLVNVHSIVDFPTVLTAYVVEAIDSAGCDRRGEIEVDVDTCLTGFMNVISDQVIIYPNPTKGIMRISLPDNEVFDLIIYDIMGKLILSENKISQNYIIVDKTLLNGTYILNLSHVKGVITRRIVIQ